MHFVWQRYKRIIT